MNSRARWLPVFPIAAVALFLALSSLALGQGPVLTSLPTPTPMPPPPDAVPAPDVIAQGPLPDLVVEKIETDPATPSVGDSTVISVTIKNQGPGSVPEGNNFLTDLYIDPPFDPVVNYHQIISPTLGLPWQAQWFYVSSPGASYVFTTTWVFTDVKTFNIWALVDSSGENETDTDGVVTEANEDNNTKKVSASVLTSQNFKHDTHQDFMTNMASTLDNDDPTGVLRLGHFLEPPALEWPFTTFINGSCKITSDSVVVTDYNMESPDNQVNPVSTGRQEKSRLIANDDGVLVAVWQDGRHGDTHNRDIYLRYSTDEGETWGSEIRVNYDPIDNHVNQLNPVVALSEDGNLLVAWQDRRNGNYDVYTQRYVLTGTTVITAGTNVLVGGASSAGDQINPDIAVDEAGGFHVAWQDSRNGSYDIFATSYISGTGSYDWTLVRRVHDDYGATQQENPSIEVLDGHKVTGVDYTIDPVPPYTVTVTGVISEPTRILVVTWEDDRNGNTDIAMVASGDGGETFGVDQFITDSSTDGNQQNPDVTLTKGIAEMSLTVTLPDDSETTVPVDVPVGDIHTVWEGYKTPANMDRDIYYNASKLDVEQIGTGSDFRFSLSVGSNEKINTGDIRDWQTGPVDQSAPALVAFPCGVDDNEGDWNLFITWSDGRNYDSLNDDIYYTVKSTCSGMPEGLAANQMLNDGVRLHNFDTSNPSYDDYDAGNPPPARQLYPSVAANIQTDWPYVLGGYLYLVWEDDRAGDPQAEKDIFFARSNLTYFNQVSGGIPFSGAGSHISGILDAGSDDATWYTIHWTAATPSSTYVTVQTRLGDTITDVLASEWYPQRFPYQPQPVSGPGECFASESGAPIPGYDAPGQHIEDASAQYWPQARYIQYRVNYFTRDSIHTPELEDLTIFYDRQGPNNGNVKDKFTYLPLILK